MDPSRRLLGPPFFFTRVPDTSLLEFFPPRNLLSPNTAFLEDETSSFVFPRTLVVSLLSSHTILALWDNFFLPYGPPPGTLRSSFWSPLHPARMLFPFRSPRQLTQGVAHPPPSLVTLGGEPFGDCAFIFSFSSQLELFFFSVSSLNAGRVSSKTPVKFADASQKLFCRKAAFGPYGRFPI